MTLKHDYETIKTISEKLGPLFALEQDIHTHTKQLGQEILAVIRIDQEHQLSTVEPINAVLKEILEFSRNDSKVNRVLQSIRSNGNQAVRETNLNLQEQICRTWNLAKHSHYGNAKELIIDNLKHNIDTKGGCLPGISARLTQPYLAFIREKVEAKLNLIPLPLIDEEEQMIFKALELSQKTYEQEYEKNNKKRKQADTQQEDRDLLTALALSKREHEENINKKIKAETRLGEDNGEYDEEFELARAISLSMSKK